MKIIKDSNDQYHSSKSISASGLKEISKTSVYHYLNKVRKETDSMIFGTAVHTALLESETFYDIYYPMPLIKDLRTKEGKILKAEAEEKSDGKILLSYYDHERIKHIIQNFKKNKLAQEYSKGEIELSHYTEYDGVGVRVRPDIINHVSGYIADVKTCQSASPESFRLDVFKWKYHLQAAFYMDILNFDEFKFICCEVNPPYAVVVHTLDSEFIEIGRKLWKQAFMDWKDYHVAGKIKLFHHDNICEDGSYLISFKR